MSKAVVKSSARITASSAGKPAAKREAAKPKKAIFDARTVAVRLDTLRQAAIEALYQKTLEEARAAATAAGQEFDEASVEITEEDIGKTHWWGQALKFDWSSARKGGNGTQWVSNEYRDAAGVAGPLVVRINGERHCGTIMPITDEGVAELAARVKNPNVTIKKRDKKPSIQIQKWNAQVKTLEDGITIGIDEEGKLILPSDDKLSPYYQVAALVNEAFVTEVKERIQRGVDFLATVRGEKVSQKAAAKAQSALDAFAKVNGPRFAGDMILSTESVGEIRKLFPNPKDHEILLRGTVQAPKVNVAKLVQETISDTAKKNAGLPLPNPMTRIAMNFDQTTGMSLMAFYDKGKPFETEKADSNGRMVKKNAYDIGKVDDDPINAENVHKFVLSRSTLDGIVNMDSVCFSNMGISMPVKADVLVVEQPRGRETTLDDVYGDDGVIYSTEDVLPEEGGGNGDGDGADSDASAPPASPPPQPSPAPQPAAAPKPAPGPAPKAAAPKAQAKPAPKTATSGKSAAPTEEDYTGLLEGLSGEKS
jgi:hypothetical protein